MNDLTLKIEFLPASSASMGFKALTDHIERTIIAALALPVKKRGTPGYGPSPIAQLDKGMLPMALPSQRRSFK